MSLAPGLGVEDDLGHAFAIAEVDEDERAVVTAIGHPTKEHDFLADVGGAQSAAIVGALELIDETGHSFSFRDRRPRETAGAVSYSAASAPRDIPENWA
jgi:hypothetical protein